MTLGLGYGLEKAIPQKGKLTVDVDGYYSLVVGAFNITSGNGPYYELSPCVKELFGPDSVLNQRLKQLIVESEHDHPSYDGIEGNTTKEVEANYMKRLLVIDPTKVCGIFKDVKLVPTGKIEYGAMENIVETHIKFKPQGPFGAEVKRQLDDPEINTAFSLRCWRRCDDVTGRKRCRVFIPITWDFVPHGMSPGISIATKENSIGLETLVSNDITFTESEITDLVAGLETMQDETLALAAMELIQPCTGNNCILNW